MSGGCLLIVDVQKGFINDWTAHIPARVEALQQSYGQIVAARFFNPEGSPFRRLIGWQRFAPGSEDTAFAFRPRSDAMVIDKPTYTCVTAGFLEGLRRTGLDRVHLCGIATDNCVLKTAVDLFEAGVTPVVLADACASHGGPDSHRAGLLLLRRLIGDAQVVSSRVGA